MAQNLLLICPIWREYLQEFSLLTLLIWQQDLLKRRAKPIYLGTLASSQRSLCSKSFLPLHLSLNGQLYAHITSQLFFQIRKAELGAFSWIWDCQQY